MKKIFIIMALYVLTSCMARMDKPISFSYRDEDIVLSILFDSFDRNESKYYGNLTLVNLSDTKKIIASRRDLKICVRSPNNTYSINIDSIASVFYYAKPNKNAEYKIFLETKNENLTEDFRIFVVNRIFKKSAEELGISVSECD